MLFNVRVAAMVHIVLVSYGEDGGIMINLVHLKEDGVDVETDRNDHVRKAVWDMLRTLSYLVTLRTNEYDNGDCD